MMCCNSAVNYKLDNPHYVIRKLCSLLDDEITSKMIDRHLDLIGRYIELSQDGFFVEDLLCVMYVLEYFGEHYDDVKDYEVPLWQLLVVCLVPPLLKKPSDIVEYSRDLQEYFTLLGYLLVILSIEDMQQLLLCVIWCLLSPNCRENTACVKVSDCQRAMEESHLAVWMAGLFEIAPPQLYTELLELSLLLVNSSNMACHGMIAGGALNGLFLRMDPEYFSRDLTQHPSDSVDLDSVPTSKIYDSNLLLSSSLLWALLNSLKDEVRGEFEIPKNNPSCSALFCFRNALHVETVQNNISTRNDLIALMLLAITVLPDLLIIESFLDADILTLSMATESGTENSWAKNVTFLPTRETLQMKKLLLMSICHLAKHHACVELFREADLMDAILALVNPGLCIPHIAWTPKQCLELATHALKVLTVLAPLLVEQFIEHKGAARVLLMVAWYKECEYDDHVLCGCLQTISGILSERTEFIREFRCEGAINILCEICDVLLLRPALTVVNQRSLTHIFFALELMLRNKPKNQAAHGMMVANIVTSCCRRAVDIREEDSRTDHRLLIAAVDLLWECVVWSPDNQKQFVRDGGVYVLLDAMQKTILPAKAIFLSALVDLVDTGDCVPHLLTWRDRLTGKAYRSMLAQVWRDEETKWSVRRTQQGAILDTDLPLMGAEQWCQTESCKPPLAATTTPAIADIFGSVRPKIFAIVNVLRQRHADKVTRTREFYRIDDLPIPTQDQVTLALAENYLALKLGEVWWEVSRDLTSAGVKTIGIDGELVSAMIDKQKRWTLLVQARQQEILDFEKEKIRRGEKDFYHSLHENHLAPALAGMRELALIARTTDRSFMDAHWERQRGEIKFSTPASREDVLQTQCTWQPGLNVTVLGGHNVDLACVSSKPLGTVEPVVQSLSSVHKSIDITHVNF